MGLKRRLVTSSSTIVGLAETDSNCILRRLLLQVPTTAPTTARYASYLGFDHGQPFLTWVDTELAGLLQPLANARMNNFSTTNLGRAPSRPQFLEVLARLNEKPTLRELLQTTTPGRVPAVPERLVKDGSTSDKDDTVGLFLAHAYLVLSHSTNGQDGMTAADRAQNIPHEAMSVQFLGEPSRAVARQRLERRN